MSSTSLKHVMFYYEIEMFCKRADEKTNIMLLYYVNNYKRVYGIYTVWCYLTAIGVICGPLLLPQQLPTHAKYPFSVEQHPVKSIIYLHQSIVGLQAAAGLCIQVNLAILLFYSSVRFDLLAQKIRNITNEHELDTCIQLHDEILRYTAKVINVVRPLLLTTITTTAIGVVFGSLNMVT
ncbi:PREDICTED: uncharacterized protein LOC106742902, partial [Dinoponera quadriceps]|uniref:Uncharacterized protein LOC106742902 n=1 Tax=Dinoponera quadriceps TaxID=609295 RepID=A0A6P3X1I3_DINQU